MNPTASASPVPDLRIGYLFSLSWRAFKTRPRFLAGATAFGNLLMPFLMGFVLELLRILLFAKSPTVGHVFKILLALLNTCFLSGLMIVSMRFWLGQDAAFGMVFAGFRRFWRILGLCLVGLAAFVAGVLLLGFLAGPVTAAAGGATLGLLTVFLILAALYLGIALGPALVVILETNLGVFSSLRLSWNLTRGHWWALFLAVLASTVFGLAGFLALGVGALVTLPVGQIMLMGAYDELARAYAARAPAATAPPAPAGA